jgi:glycosyltransferase involved in cell wall biosynthesis
MILQVGNLNSKITGSFSYQESLNEKLKKLFKSEIISISSKKNKLFRILEIIYFLVIKCFKIKIVVIHSFSTLAFYMTLIAAILCRLLNIKYIVIVHGGDYPNRIKKSPFFIKMIFKYSYLNISPSKYLQYEFSNLGYDFKFIPNAIDLKLFKFKERIEFKPNLLWVRAFDKIYNPTMAVLVVFQLKKKYPNVKLWMVGNKCDHSYNETVALINKLNLKDNIELTGVLSHKDWAELSQKADIFINTTNIDNMPVSVLQAMALGLPVFSTDVGGVKWLIDDKINGIKCSAGNIDEMSDKILYYLNNQKELSILSKNARDIPLALQWDLVLPLWKEILYKYDK